MSSDAQILKNITFNSDQNEYIDIWSDGFINVNLIKGGHKLSYGQAMELVSGLLQYATQLPAEEGGYSRE